jgi:prepilin signal peptidase PulO-like enzyme (type II secretory pathway)
MIPIHLQWLVFICLLVFLVGIFLVWVGYEVARRQRSKLAVRGRLRCPVCCMEFVDRTASVLATCPRSGSLNERHQPKLF